MSTSKINMTGLWGCFDQYSYLYAGIDQLLNSRKLNSALVHPPFVRKALTRLSQRVCKEHQYLQIGDYRDLYLLDTSFVFQYNVFEFSSPPILSCSPWSLITSIWPLGILNKPGTISAWVGIWPTR